MKSFFSIATFFTLLAKSCQAGPLSALTSYGVCQTGCNAVVVSCYAASGATFGVATGGTAMPAAIVACNTSLGVCMTACWAVTGGAMVTPTP